MDPIVWREKLRQLWCKYRYAILILVLGIILMSFPARKEEKMPSPVPPPSAGSDDEQRLIRILSQIEGAGRVDVMLTEAEGARTWYQTDEDRSKTGESTSDRRKTVLVSGSGREAGGLVQQVDPPVYLGAVVVCQGADRTEIRLAVTQAVAAVTGLGTNRITVVKMK